MITHQDQVGHYVGVRGEILSIPCCCAATPAIRGRRALSPLDATPTPWNSQYHVADFLSYRLLFGTLLVSVQKQEAVENFQKRKLGLKGFMLQSVCGIFQPARAIRLSSLPVVFGSDRGCTAFPGIP